MLRQFSDCLRPVHVALVRPWLIAAAGVLALSALLTPRTFAADAPATAEFRTDIQPILQKHCYDCHGDGAKKGQVAFDSLKSDSAILDPGLWYRALRNVRAGLMPPPGKDRPSAAERQKLEHWIKFGAFASDPKNPDPGRVTIRRLNRTEYRNSVRDLLGVDFDTSLALPPDDVGYGFDNIGDVLSISPMRMEKFIEAAIAVVEKSMPMDTVSIPSQMALPADYLSADGSLDGDHLTFYQVLKVSRTYHAKAAGDYRIHIAGKVDGEARPDPQLCRVHILSDDKEFFAQDYHWSDAEYYDDERVIHWEPGDHQISFVTQPLLPDLKPLRTKMDYRILYVRLEGPLDRKQWEHPPGYNRFYPLDKPPEDLAQRRGYARQILGNLVPRAFRRPVSDEILNQLVDLAEKNYSLPGVPFEKGIAQAVVAALSSPRFLFHMETAEPIEAGQKYARIDEYTLASRLSFALWCSIPDAELTQLAARGELRKNFDAQVKRMLKDPKAQAFVENFSGQWLQARSILDLPINSAVIMASETATGTPPPVTAPTIVVTPVAPKPAVAAATANSAEGAAPTTGPSAGQGTQAVAGRGPARQAPRRGRGGGGGGGSSGMALTPEVRVAMKQELEAYFSHVVAEDRSVLEFLQSDYTFVNETLAPVYGFANIKGPEMRQVMLPANDPRGGVLTMGSVLTVTSNPTRTSPVKRGKWILENILGSPPAPPPPNIPALEDTQNKITDRKPTQREVLALHRASPLCSSCHARMDPLGLALENFNAFGRFRTQEHGQPIESSGELATGEKFAGVRDMKRALADKHRPEFYRTLTEKMLTYVLGRGIEYYDVATVDGIVDRMEKEDGRFSALLSGVLESAPFQQRRPLPNAVNAETAASNQGESSK